MYQNILQNFIVDRYIVLLYSCRLVDMFNIMSITDIQYTLRICL